LTKGSDSYNIEEIFELLEIKNTIEERTANYNPKKNVSWEKV